MLSVGSVSCCSSSCDSQCIMCIDCSMFSVLYVNSVQSYVLHCDNVACYFLRFAFSSLSANSLGDFVKFAVFDSRAFPLAAVVQCNVVVCSLVILV